MTKEKKLTGYPSIDKPWLKLYSKEAINITVPDMTMYRLIYDSNKDRLSNTAIKYFDHNISYRTFFEQVKKVASALKSYGINAGDIVSIISLNTPETVFAIYALNYIGAVANLMIATSSKSEVLENIKFTNSKMVFILDKILEKYGVFEIEVPVIVLLMAESAKGFSGMILKLTQKTNKRYLSYKNFVEKGEAEVKEASEVNAPAIIVYTSGSTGNPKGVVLNNRNLNAVAVQCYVSGKNYKPYERFLNILPPFFSFGIGMMHLCFYTGMTEIVALVPQVKPVIKMLKKYKPERFVIGPAITDVIEKNPLKDLSFVIDLTGGGGSITLEKERTINSILESKKANSKYLVGYGMTELSSAVSMNHNDRCREQSIGLPLTLTNMMVVDVEEGHELTYGEEGEILVCSPSLMIEYYNNPVETEAAIEIRDGDRWLHTGDIGKIDEDGYVYITGRLKRIYITKDAEGMVYKLFPQRMEEVIEKCEEVERCAVIVVDDEKKEKVPVVFVVSTCDQDVVKKSVKRLVDEQLPVYYIPKEIIVLDRFPMNSSQKIDYKKLEEKIAKGDKR